MLVRRKKVWYNRNIRLLGRGKLIKIKVGETIYETKGS